MHDHLGNMHQGSIIRITSLWPFSPPWCWSCQASQTRVRPTKRARTRTRCPLSGETIIDLQKVVWEPLKGEGIPPGVQIARLREIWPLAGVNCSSAFPPTSRFLTTAIPVMRSAYGSKGTLPMLLKMAPPPAQPAGLHQSPGQCAARPALWKTPCVFYVRYPGPFDYRFTQCRRGRNDWEGSMDVALAQAQTQWRASLHTRVQATGSRLIPFPSTAPDMRSDAR